LLAIVIIRGDWPPPEELEVVGGHFSIGSAAFDPSCFFGTDDASDRDGASARAIGAPAATSGFTGGASPALQGVP
jgi:hypothetical protein